MVQPGQHDRALDCYRSNSPGSCWQRPPIENATVCHDGRCTAPCFAGFHNPVLIPTNYLLLGLLGKKERMNFGRFRLDLALKTQLGRNKVIKLGSFLDCILIQALGFHLFQSIYANFLFLFSFCIICLFLFILLNIVDLVYV